MTPTFFQRKSVIIAAVVIVLISIVASVVFFFKNTEEPFWLAADTLPRPTNETYLKLQAGLEEIRPLWDAQVNKESLRLGDVDGDGDMDAVGFVALSYTSGHKDAALTTWIQEGESIRLYEDGYFGFRTITPGDCVVVGISPGELRLDCAHSIIGNTVVLRYQPNGSGYYRDIASEAVAYTPKEGWLKYESVSSGVSFMYPPDLVVTEETFIIRGERRSIISGTRADLPSFRIVTTTSDANSGGSLVSNNAPYTFLALPDGSYLSRSQDYPSSGRSYYQELFIEQINNEGSLFARSSFPPVKEGVAHSLVGFASETNEADRIFSSLSYGKADFSAPVHPTPSSTISLTKGFSVTVPAYVEPEPVVERDGVLEERKVLVRVVPGEVYEPIPLSVALLPFGSVGLKTIIGESGYDADTNLCYRQEKENTAAPLLVHGYSACGYGFFDGSEGAHGYYLLDPSRRFIAQVHISGSYDQSLLDLAALVQTAQFAP